MEIIILNSGWIKYLNVKDNKIKIIEESKKWLSLCP